MTGDRQLSENSAYLSTGLWPEIGLILRLHRDKKLKCTATKTQNSLIYSFNGDKLITDTDDHNPGAQHGGFKSTEQSPILTKSVRAYQAIEQFLTMPAKDISDHRSFPFRCGPIHSIHRPVEFGLHKAQILIRGGIRQCQQDTHSQYRHDQAQPQDAHPRPSIDCYRIDAQQV